MQLGILNGSPLIMANGVHRISLKNLTIWKAQGTRSRQVYVFVE